MTPHPPGADSASPRSTIVSSGSSNRPNKRLSAPSDAESDADNTRDASRLVNGKGSGITVETPPRRRKRKRRKTNGKDKAKDHPPPVAGPSTERVHEPKNSITPPQRLITSLYVPAKESLHQIAHSDRTMSSDSSQPPTTKPASPPTVLQAVDEVIESHAPSSQASSSTVPQTPSTQPQRVEQTGVQAQASITSLQTELSQKTETVQAHATLLKSILTTVTCQICLDPMYKPYTLAPCGHTSCYSCLVSWFRAPPPDAGPGLAPHLDSQNDSMLALSSSMLIRKKKTCPQCRGVVQVAPIESWSLKSILGSLGASGLLQDVIRPSEDRGPAESSGSGAPEGGPWHGIFRKTNDQPSHGRWGDLAWLLDGDDDDDDVGWGVGEYEPHHAPVGDNGIVDEEDGVRRCSNCLHEIWGTVCSSCGLIYPDLSGDGGEDDLSDYSVGSFEDDPDRQEFVFDHIRRMAARYRPGVGSDDAMADGGDDESYEGSFIDDGDGRLDGIVQEPSDHDRPILLDDDDDNSEVFSPLRPTSRSTRRTRLAPTSSEDEDEDEVTSHTRFISRHSESSDSDSASRSSESTSSDENPIVRRPSTRTRRIVDSGDDDSDSDNVSDRSL